MSVYFIARHCDSRCVLSWFQFVDLAESLAFYRDKDPRLIFQEREASRAVGPAMLMDGVGMGGQAGYLGVLGGMAGYRTNVTKGNKTMHFTSQY